MSNRKDDAAATDSRSGLLRPAVFWLTIVLCAGPSGYARGAEALAIDASTGKVTIGEVLSSPDEKLSREVIRVIKASKGHWVPRRVRGVPQRTAYEYRINFT